LNLRQLKIIIILSCLCTALAAQHDAGYSQYMFNGLVINPAYAGSNGVLNVTATYRNQWTGFDDAPKTTALAAHSPFKKESSSMGLLVLNDRFGLTVKNRFQLAYAYRLKLKDNLFLRFGLQAGMESLRNDYTKLLTIQSGDASFNDAGRYNYLVTGGGLYLHSDKFFTGLSIPVMYDTYRFGGKNFRTTFFYSGLKIRLNSSLHLQPSFLIKYLKHSTAQVDLNALLIYKELLGGGLSYRSNESFVANLYYQLNKQFFAGYAFEANTGKLSVLARTSHELTIKYLFSYYRKIQNPKTFF
jgi:type IX secretion system PorP/SprF family membrane protein